jgi:alkyl hydroperoxide reductase subunit AhpF
MALISATDQERLREMFAEMSRPVRLLFFTQTLGCETCLQTKEILDELPPLSDKVTIDEINLVLDQEKATQYGIDRAPGIAVAYQNGSAASGDAESGGAPSFTDSRMRFLGTPSGYEFMALIHAILLAGGRIANLSDEARARVAAIDKPLKLQVFTTPG